jgi:hypothetical protein
MAEPSKKPPEIEAFLEAAAGRTTAIKGNMCIRKPFGCEGSATEFKDDLSRREYSISGLCQKCQDRIFGEG